MAKKRARPLALGVIRRERDGAMLVSRGHDEATGEEFFRPLGGAVEFQESSAEALRREFLEEIDATLDGVRLLGVLENIFTYHGKPKHEIVFVYEARFADRRLYERESFEVIEGGGPWRTAVWRPVDSFEAEGAAALYPQGLRELLRRSASR
ncbi:MAG: NUDIX hydrolase [Phycisphaerales bacterium]